MLWPSQEQFTSRLACSRALASEISSLGLARRRSRRGVAQLRQRRVLRRRVVRRAGGDSRRRGRQGILHGLRAGDSRDDALSASRSSRACTARSSAAAWASWRHQTMRWRPTTAALRLSELAVGIGPFVVGPVIERKIGAGAFGAMAIDADWRDAEWARTARAVRAGAGQRARRSTRRSTHWRERSPPPTRRRCRASRRSRGLASTIGQRLLEERAAMSGTLVLSDFTRAAIASFAGGAR